MAYAHNLNPPIITKHASIISRFKEQFSESSNDHVSQHRDHDLATVHRPTHLIKQLSKEQRRQRKNIAETSQNRSSIGAAIGRQRSKRISNDTASAYARHRSVAQERAFEYQNAKECRKKHEKDHKQRSRLGGAVWGYDPMASRVAEARTFVDEPQGCYIFRGARSDDDEYGIEEIDMFGRRTSRLFFAGSTWGIELGGPGRPPQFEPSDIRQIQQTASSRNGT